MLGARLFRARKFRGERVGVAAEDGPHRRLPLRGRLLCVEARQALALVLLAQLARGKALAVSVERDGGI